MKLINEHYEGTTLESFQSLPKYHFEYVVSPADFVLVMNNVWNVVDEEVEWYVLRIGDDHLVRLPANIYIMLADVYGDNVDWVRVDEIPGRTLTTALYFSDLAPDKWTIETVEVFTVEEDTGKVMFPNTKNLLPVLVGDDRMILCSDKDSFVKTKKMNFACLY